MKKITLLVTTLVLSMPVINAQMSGKDVAKKVAAAYGVDNFKNAKAMTFTFNAKQGTAAVSSRGWNWNIVENIVTMITTKETVTYRRDTIKSAAMKSIDQKFINDQYWIIFPYHLVWDNGFTLTTKEKAVSPISKKNRTLLTVQYDSQGGYTPGDAYDLYLDNNFMICEWTYRSGGTQKPTFSTTWQDIIKIKGLTIATNHQSADGKFSIYFNDVTVK